jgi:hypothetical protein
MAEPIPGREGKAGLDPGAGAALKHDCMTLYSGGSVKGI